MKLKDFVNIKTNKRNHQISLDVKKKKLAMEDIDVEDLLCMSIYKGKLSKFKKGDF